MLIVLHGMILCLALMLIVLHGMILCVPDCLWLLAGRMRCRRLPVPLTRFSILVLLNGHVGVCNVTLDMNVLLAYYACRRGCACRRQESLRRCGGL
jgi:hypothetical protein